MHGFLVDSFLAFAVIAALSIALGAWVIRLGIFFFYRWKHRAQPNPHEKKETMGLPKGAMRTFLALSFTAIATLAIFQSDEIISVDDKKWIIGQLGVIIAFYFGSKAVEAYVESRTKLRAIDKAYTADEAMKIYREAEEPAPRPSGPVPTD